MGFNQHPCMSTRMYREIIQPGHRRTIDWAHGHKLPVIMHSCGFVEPLVPGMLDAGMELLRLHNDIGNRLLFMGGIYVRCLYNYDMREIKAELEGKIPVVKIGNGYILQSDHSIPSNVDHDVYRDFIRKCLELGNYSW